MLIVRSKLTGPQCFQSVDEAMEFVRIFWPDAVVSQPIGEAGHRAVWATFLAERNGDLFDIVATIKEAPCSTPRK